MWYVEQYHEMHTATHTNGGCYLVGIIFGYLYLQLRKNSISLKKSKVYEIFNHFFKNILQINLILSSGIHFYGG